jgi:hypothetical protein
MKSRRIRWDTAGVGEKRNVHKILIGKSERKGQHGRLVIGGSKILKLS